MEGNSAASGAMILAVDLDGTVADGSERERIASEARGPRSTYWDTLFDPKLYYLDQPVPFSASFLRRWCSLCEAGGSQPQLVYLSGRRKGGEAEIKEWLQKYDFPECTIILRPAGVPTKEWKTSLTRRGDLKGYIGDHADDLEAAQKAGVPGFQVVANNWFSDEDVDDILAAVAPGFSISAEKQARSSLQPVAPSAYQQASISLQPVAQTELLNQALPPTHSTPASSQSRTSNAACGADLGSQ